MRRVAVTGASGFVGRRLLAALTDHDVATNVLGRSEPTDPATRFTCWQAPEPVPPEAFDDVHAVVHLAAHVPRRMDDPDEAVACLEVNALGTLAVTRAAVQAGCKHVIVVSTGNLYRPGPAACEDDAVFPDHRATYYLASKLVGELWARYEGRRAAIPITVLRPSAIYGPGMTGGVVRTFVDRLRHREPLVLHDGGRFRSDLVFVDDVVRAILRALDVRPSGTLNVGSGSATSVADLAAALVELMGADPELIRVEPAQDGAPGGFAPLDVTRATRELGLVPTPLNVGLARLLAEEAT